MTYAEAIAEAERVYWTALIAETCGNVAQMAHIAGVNRAHCYVLLERAGLHNRRAQNVGNSAWQELRV